MPRSAVTRVLLRTSLITIALLLITFAVATVAEQLTARRMVTQEEAVRRAQMEGSLVLRLQLDEETGVRGYALTGERTFLTPYMRARGKMGAALQTFASQAGSIDASMVPLERGLRAINSRWLTRVASPLIANRVRGDRGAREIEGKMLIDRFRSLWNRAYLSLNAVAQIDDRDASNTLRRILDGSVLFGVALALGLFFYAGVQARLAHEIATRGQEYERLRRMTATMQEAFLAEPLPQVRTLTFDAVYAPALEEARVGGDWYGVFALPDGRVYFSMGDVAGHGIAASVLMARIRQTVLSLAMHERDPAVVLSRANDVLRLSTDTFVTALCGFVDPRTFEIAYATAGHWPPLLIGPDGEGIFLPYTGTPLGVAPDPGTRTFVRQALPGSMLVLYTDGITEFDHDVIAGERRLREVARTVWRENGEHPASAILGGTLHLAKQSDDIALLVIRFNAQPVAVGAGSVRSETEEGESPSRRRGDPDSRSDRVHRLVLPFTSDPATRNAHDLLHESGWELPGDVDDHEETG